MDALFCVPGMAIHIEEETAHARHGQPTLVKSAENHVLFWFASGSDNWFCGGFIN